MQLTTVMLRSRTAAARRPVQSGSTLRTRCRRVTSTRGRPACADEDAAPTARPRTASWGRASCQAPESSSEEASKPSNRCSSSHSSSSIIPNSLRLPAIPWTSQLHNPTTTQRRRRLATASRRRTSILRGPGRQNRRGSATTTSRS